MHTTHREAILCTGRSVNQADKGLEMIGNTEQVTGNHNANDAY